MSTSLAPLQLVVPGSRCVDASQLSRTTFLSASRRYVERSVSPYFRAVFSLTCLADFFPRVSFFMDFLVSSSCSYQGFAHSSSTPYVLCVFSLLSCPGCRVTGGKRFPRRPLSSRRAVLLLSRFQLAPRAQQEEALTPSRATAPRPSRLLALCRPAAASPLVRRVLPGRRGRVPILVHLRALLSVIRLLLMAPALRRRGALLPAWIWMRP